MKEKVTFFWFRRDLRIEDNAALFYALKEKEPVQPLFIFDINILDRLNDKQDRRVDFIFRQVSALRTKLAKKGVTLLVKYGDPIQVWKQLYEEFNIATVYANRDYESYALDRDKQVWTFLDQKSTPFYAKKDHVIFERQEVLKKDGTPYLVFTPYSRAWKAKLTDFYLKAYPSENIDHWHKAVLKNEVNQLEDIGFSTSDLEIPSMEIPGDIISDYHMTRDTPSIKGTSRLSVHLRFGTISIRSLARAASGLNETYLNELIWRDFYSCFLWHFPESSQHNFRRKYDLIQWRNDEADFKKWCEGNTGYPIVDAGMRELNTTGFMHNRVRMIVASFLTKHLLIDWRWGEAYFAEKLLDYDMASNVGGWQWASGTGVDAAPYFRIFNPSSQTKKFDPKFEYIRRWVPEFQELSYPEPMVNHEFARKRCLETYQDALKD